MISFFFGFLLLAVHVGLYGLEELALVVHGSFYLRASWYTEFCIEQTHYGRDLLQVPHKFVVQLPK